MTAAGSLTNSHSRQLANSLTPLADHLQSTASVTLGSLAFAEMQQQVADLSI